MAKQGQGKHHDHCCKRTHHDTNGCLAIYDLTVFLFHDNAPDRCWGSLEHRCLFLITSASCRASEPMSVRGPTTKRPDVSSSAPSSAPWGSPDDGDSRSILSGIWSIGFRCCNERLNPSNPFVSLVDVTCGCKTFCIC